MCYILYKVTNIINNKIYIGVHKQTDDYGPFDFDGSLGSGDQIKKAVTKYGKTCFIRETLGAYDHEETAYMHEAAIVNETFVSDRNTYNISLGGKGPRPSRCAIEKRSANARGVKHPPESIERRSENVRNTVLANRYDWYSIQDDFDNGMKAGDLYKKYNIDARTLHMARERKLFVGKYLNGGFPEPWTLFKWSLIQVDFNNGMAFVNLCKKYDINALSFYRARKQGWFEGMFNRKDWGEVQNDFDSGMLYADLCMKHDLRADTLVDARKRGDFNGKYNGATKGKPISYKYNDHKRGNNL